jgi:hypothetical protein
MLLLVIEFVYHQMKHSSLSYNLFKVMYDYKSIFDIYIKNDVIQKKLSAVKEHVEMLQDMQNRLMQ